MLSSVDSLRQFSSVLGVAAIRQPQLRSSYVDLRKGSKLGLRWNLEKSREGCELGRRRCGGLVRAMAASVDASAAGKTLESWEALAGMLGKDEVPERLPSVKRRVFEEGQEPALVFYRDNSSWCPYCQRVWLQLEEKRIPYTVEKINMRCYGEKPAWFTKMVPSGLLPVVELDGKVVTESMDIMFLIEQRFPDHNPLLPSDGPELAAVDPLLQLERRLAGAWLNRLRSSWPDMNGFENTMDKVNSALQQFGGPYFLGSKVSHDSPNIACSSFPIPYRMQKTRCCARFVN
jgi:glutaredoxin